MTLRTVMQIGGKQLAQTARQCASKRGGSLVKKFKDGGVGTGARSGQHGIPYSRAGAQLRREANELARKLGDDNPLVTALRKEADRLIHKARSINH